MSVQNEIDRINQNVTDSYEALNSMGATMPSDQNSDNLASTIYSIPRAGGAVEEIFYVPFSFGATGFALDGVTHAEILAEYNSGKRIIAKGYVPSAANLGFAGVFELPLSYFAENKAFVLTLTSGKITGEVWILSDNTIEPHITTLATLGDIKEKTFIVEFLLTLSASGMSISLPEDVTFEDINAAYDNNLHVVGVFDVPTVAGELAGKYIAPLNKRNSDGSLLFIAIVPPLIQCITVAPTGQVGFSQTIVEVTSAKISAISDASTHYQYPTAKAVYDFVNANSGKTGVRYGFDANTGTLYLYGDGEFYGNRATQHEDINAFVKHIVFFENISSVHDYAFRNGYPNLETVSFCNSVTSIGYGAFTLCEKLKKVHLPKNITYIEELLFAATALEEIRIPAAVTSISNSFSECEKLKSVIFEKGSELLDLVGSFEYCTALEKIDLPKKLTALGRYVFYGDTALKQIYLPASLTSIGDNCFKGCNALEFVLYGGTPEQWEQISIGTGNDAVTEENLYFLVESGVDESASEKYDETDADAVGALYEVFYNENNMDESGLYAFIKFYLPENAYSDTYYAIGAQLASDYNPCAVDICEGIKELRAGAFAYSGIKEIKLPESLEVINHAAFVGCENLESISIPENVTRIGNEVFAGCTALKKIYIPKGCKIELGATVFDGCESLTDIYYGGSEEGFCGHLEDDLTSSDMEAMLGLPYDAYTIHYNATGLPE